MLFNRSSLCVAVAVTVVMLSIVPANPVAGQTSEDTLLPGAQPIIEARRFHSLQEALDAVPESGGIVRLPPGRFEITEPLVLRRGETRLEGVGAATHIVNLNRDGKPALILQHKDGRKAKRKDNLWRISLADFRITGNEKSGHGIVALRIDEVFLHDMTVTHHGGDGVLLDYCFEDARVNDCLINYNKGAGLRIVGCHDIVVSSNHFEENQDAVQCIDSFNLCMTGNCVDDHLGRGVLIENTYGSVLSGNMIEECQGAAIVLDRYCHGITISSNLLALNQAGIDLKDAHGCAVTGNTLALIKTAALRIGPLSGRITVTGNNFSDSYVGVNRAKAPKEGFVAAGLILEGAKDVSITGNVFSGLRPKAVALVGAKSEGVIFASNRIVDSPSDLTNDPTGDANQPKNGPPDDERTEQ